MNINHYLSKNEQKILFFLLVMGLIGISVHFAGNQGDAATDMEALRKTVASHEKILYDINTVTAEELRTISGIGEVRAAAIVSYRDENRPISLDDVINVRGIGPKTLETMRDYFYADND